jgi:hypothetical protein
MCDSAEGNWVWSLRDKRTGKNVTTDEGYAYYFAEEADARALATRLNREVELIQTREPGA